MEQASQASKNKWNKEVSDSAFEIEKHINNFGAVGDLIGLDEHKKEAIYSLGHYQYTHGKYAEAFKTFQIIVINDPLNRRAIKALGSCLQMLNYYEDALKQLAMAVYMEPSDPGPTLQIAECMLALNKKEDATNLLKKIKNEFGSIEKYKEINIKVLGLLELLKIN